MLFTDKTLLVKFVGARVPYQKGMDVMRAAIDRIKHEGSSCREFELLFLEHRDSITTTRQNGEKSFLKPKSEIENLGIEVIETDRGGDVTFHGCGQLVGYLVIRLEPVDLVGYVRTLENALLCSMKSLGVDKAFTLEQKTGIWVNSGSSKKLVAIGVGVSNSVTRHGFALNICTDLEKFTSCVVPCGLHGYGVTSMQNEILEVPSPHSICKNIAEHIGKAFRLNLRFEHPFAARISKLSEQGEA